MVDLNALTAAVEAGDRKSAVSLTQEAIDEGIAPDVILGAMTTAMTEVGRKFACNEGVYVPEMLISAHAMKEASVLLEPLLAASGMTPEYTAVIGTVKGDLHDIGKNLVGMMLKGANFAVVDLGTNVAPEAFAAAATRAQGPRRRHQRPPDHHDGGHARRRGGHPRRRPRRPRSSSAGHPSPTSSPPRSAPTASPRTPRPRPTWPRSCSPRAPDDAPPRPGGDGPRPRGARSLPHADQLHAGVRRAAAGGPRRAGHAQRRPRRRAQPARRRQHLRARAGHRRRPHPDLGRLGQLLLPGPRHLHRRVGRHLAGASLRDALRDGPLHRDGGLPPGRGRGHRQLPAARPASAGAVPRLRARHPRVRRRVLDRGRHGHDHLGDGLGAARLRAAAHGPPHRPRPGRAHPGHPLPLPPGGGRAAGLAWAWT